LPIVDAIAAGALALAVIRGLWIGLLREAFSLAALVAAVFAVRRFAAPTADALAARYQLEPIVATAAAGALVAVVTIVVIALVGAILRRSIRTVGLGLADRLGGGVLGAAEGALVVAILVIGAIAVLGRSDPLLAGSRTLALFERVEAAFGEAPAPAHAAEPARPGPATRPASR
jgi:membrane protein required for colicin V production